MEYMDNYDIVHGRAPVVSITHDKEATGPLKWTHSWPCCL